MQIGGFLYPIQRKPQEGAFFLPLTTAWGWATWQRAWQAFDPHPGDVTEFLAEPANRNAFTLAGAYPYDKILEQSVAGSIEAWDIQWWYAVFRAKGLVLYPERSLVMNDGFDKSGANSGGG